MAIDTGVGAQGKEDEECWPPTVALAEPHVIETRVGLHRAVWMLAWPSVLTMLLQTVNSFTDRFFVGHLGSDALAAVGVAGQLMFLLFSVGMSVSVGTTALVARFTGAQEPDEATVAANQSVWIAGIASLLCVALMLPLRGAVVAQMHLSAPAAALCVQYLTLTILGVPALFLMLILGGVYRGLGDTVTPLLVMLGVNVIHLGGDFLLIFGNAGFPKLGLPGGALALLCSQVVGAILYVTFLRRSPVSGLLTRKRRLEMAWARRILNIGVPAALQNLSRVLSMLLFTGVLARTPEATAGVAALTIGLTSESIAFMPGFAFSTAASTLTGQNLGAKNPDRAERAAWAALGQGLSVMVAMGTVFFIFAPQFAHLFTHDPQVVPLAVAYLRISALAEPFLGFGMILTGALNGAGDTKAPAWASAVTMWGVRLPLAVLLAQTLRYGTVGAWWAMAASTVAGGLWAWYLFKRGRWKTVAV
ncbi:MAG: MATE family efflux transporter [Armatimonadetes bacterium]|nr:MATE family efflux transporter [Armatimonadota bacterium]